MFFSLLIGLIAHLPCAKPSNYPEVGNLTPREAFNASNAGLLKQKRNNLEHLFKTFDSILIPIILNQESLHNIVSTRENAIYSASLNIKNYRLGMKESKCPSYLKNFKKFYLSVFPTSANKKKFKSELDSVLDDKFCELKKHVAKYEEKIKKLMAETIKKTIDMLKTVYTEEMVNKVKSLSKKPDAIELFLNVYVLSINALISTFIYCIVMDSNELNKSFLSDPENFRSYFGKNKAEMNYETMEEGDAYIRKCYVESLNFPAVFEKITKKFFEKTKNYLPKSIRREIDLGDYTPLLSGVEKLSKDFLSEYVGIILDYRHDIVLELISLDTKADQKVFGLIGNKLNLHETYPNQYNHLFNEILQLYLVTRCEVSN